MKLLTTTEPTPWLAWQRPPISFATGTSYQRWDTKSHYQEYPGQWHHLEVLPICTPHSVGPVDHCVLGLILAQCERILRDQRLSSTGGTSLGHQILQGDQEFLCGNCPWVPPVRHPAKQHELSEYQYQKDFHFQHLSHPLPWWPFTALPYSCSGLSATAAMQMISPKCRPSLGHLNC